MQNGMMFMGDGPIMTGTWQNPRTGDSFTVRDTYFEDNNLIVMATDGRRFNYDMIQQYVQVDSNNMPQAPVINEPVAEPVGNPSLGLDDLEKEANDLLKTELKTELPATPQAPQVLAAPQAPVQAALVDEDHLLITRMLGRVEEPKIKFEIDWKKYPQKQFEMLDMLGVDLDKSIEFIVNRIDAAALRREVTEALRKYINRHQSAEEQAPVVEKPAKPATKVAKPATKAPKVTKTVKK